MLLGYPPFYSDDPSSTVQKVVQHTRYFVYPQEPRISALAMDLIEKLVTDQTRRIGYEDIIRHPWFGALSMNKLREYRAPYVPQIASELDTSNFDKYEEQEPWVQKGGRNSKKEMTFVGYTFKMEDFEEKRPI